MTYSVKYNHVLIWTTAITLWLKRPTKGKRSAALSLKAIETLENSKRSVLWNELNHIRNRDSSVHYIYIYVYIIENYVDYIYWNHPVYLIGWGGGIGYRYRGIFVTRDRSHLLHQRPFAGGNWSATDFFSGPAGRYREIDFRDANYNKRLHKISYCLRASRLHNFKQYNL